MVTEGEELELVVRFSNNGVQMNMAVERGPFDGQPPKPTTGNATRTSL
jgi:hypothetical protein